MSLALTLKAGDDTKTWDLLEIPLTEDVKDNISTVTTLNNKTYTYIIGDRKRSWTHAWSYLDSAEFAEIRRFYDLQMLNYETVYLTITGLQNVVEVPVLMTMSGGDVISNDGMIKEVRVVFKEL